MKTNETVLKDADGYQLLPAKFEWKGYSFTFIKNLGNWKIYEKISNSTGNKHYEIIKPQKQEEYVFHGSVIPKKYSYPGTNSFGRIGYDCISVARCEELYKTWILPRENKNIEEYTNENGDLVYPDGKFLKKDLKSLNKKLTISQISVRLKKDLQEAKIKIVGEKENKRGKNSIIYKKI